MKITKRLAIFVFVGLLTFGLGVWVTRMTTFMIVCPVNIPAWRMLLSFENQDLLKLDAEARQMVEAAVQEHTGKRYENRAGRFQPALFRSMLNTKGEKRYVLVEVAPLVFIPGNTSLRVHVFDTTGLLLNAQEFNAGYRQSLISLQVRDNLYLASEALVVDTGYVFTAHVGRAYYVLVDNEVNLVYRETNGNFYPNNNETPHMAVGPRAARSVDEWEKELSSGNNAQVLSALVWFSGQALPPRAGVQKRLQELRKSENLWIKTAAQSALEKQ